MVLVIGGAGYIGSHMVKYLLHKGESVVVFDNFSTGHRRALTGGILEQGDLRDLETLLQVFRKHPIECVMHFAAYIFAGESMRNPAKYYDNNVLGCLRLMEAMRIAGVSQMIFSSTAAVYGEPVEVPIPETHPLAPTNTYGETKRVMEACCAGTGRRMASAPSRYATSTRRGQTPTANSAKTTAPKSI